MNALEPSKLETESYCRHLGVNPFLQVAKYAPDKYIIYEYVPNKYKH